MLNSPYKKIAIAIGWNGKNNRKKPRQKHVWGLCFVIPVWTSPVWRPGEFQGNFSILGKNDLISFWANYPFNNLGNILEASGSSAGNTALVSTISSERCPASQMLDAPKWRGLISCTAINHTHYQSLVWQPRVIKRKLSQRECLWRSEASRSLHTLIPTLVLYL